MTLQNYVVTSRQMQAPASGLVLFKQQIPFDPKELWALTKDFFSWFENEWRQPVVRPPDSDSNRLLDELSSVPSVIAEETYCFKDLASIWHFGMGKVKKDISVGKVQAIGVTPRLGRGGKGRNIYRGRDLTQVVREWEWERLCQYLDARWEHFLPEPCGICAGCHENPNTAIFYCQRNIHHAVKRYRTSLFRFLGVLRNYADIESWWRHEREGAFARKPQGINSRTGIVLLYLLDRHLLDLTLDDILRLPIPDMKYDDLLRPWQHRRPEEYEAFLHGLDAAKYGKWMQKHTLALMSVMVLLKYGFPGVTELGRRLAPEEVQQALNEGRLLTMYLGHGAFLGFPLSDDICVGHVVLDDIRLYFWDFMAARMPTLDERCREHRGSGPRQWQLCHIMAVERALGANIWQSGQALLSPRPETEKWLYNPYFARLRSEQGEPALHLLPQMIQESVQAYITYRYQAQRITLGSLKGDVKRIMPFLSWAFTHTDLSHYDRWDRSTMRGILSTYLAAKCSNIDITSR